MGDGHWLPEDKKPSAHKVWVYANQACSDFYPDKLEGMDDAARKKLHVKKGEKAITLCMPVTLKRRFKRSGSAASLDPPTNSVVRVGDGAERQLTGPRGQVEE